MKLKRWIAIAVFFAAGGQAVTSPAASGILLSAAEFKKAILGQEFSTNGLRFPAAEGGAFPYGYIMGIAATEAQAGRWCAAAILPHETMARVSDYIETLHAPDTVPAEVAVTDALRAIKSCEGEETPQ